MKETTKSNKRRARDPETWNAVLRGDVLDIGCGDDPLKAGTFEIKTVQTFDRKDGDANVITRYIKRQFDCVYGSQVLEHMINPFGCMLMWWSLVKPGGHMVITIPDEDLYEQEIWPSKWNSDHKWTFRLHNLPSWSRVSIRPQYMAMALPDAEVLRAEVVDTNYDRSIVGQDQTLKEAEAWIELIIRKAM